MLSIVLPYRADARVAVGGQQNVDTKFTIESLIGRELLLELFFVFSDFCFFGCW